MRKLNLAIVERYFLLRFVAYLLWTVVLIAPPGRVSAADTPRAPLVFVPGILGSRLCKGNVVLWGTANSLRNLRSLEILPGTSGTDIQPCGIIRNVQILGPLYTIHQYDSLVDALKKMGYVEGKTLFEFDYDWRLSTVENARRLEKHVERVIPQGQHFDLLAHSMGGMVTRLYLQKPENAQRVERVVYLGVPFFGSWNSLGNLLEGWGEIANWIAGGMEGIRTTILSWPGFLELLPRYSDSIRLKDQQGRYTSLNVFDANTWRERDWLPKGLTHDATFQLFKDSLRQAGELTPILAASPHGEVKEFFIAADTIGTRYRLGMEVGKTWPTQDNWKFKREPGDGTVTAWSAARDPEQKSYANAAVSFAPHQTIFADSHVVDQIHRDLFDSRPDPKEPIAREGRPTLVGTKDGKPFKWEILDVEFHADPCSQKVGGAIDIGLVVRLDASSSVVAGAYEPIFFLTVDGKSYALRPRDLTNEADLAARELHFWARTTARGQGSLMEISTTVSAIPLQTYTLVMP